MGRTWPPETRHAPTTRESPANQNTHEQRCTVRFLARARCSLPEKRFLEGSFSGNETATSNQRGRRESNTRPRVNLTSLTGG